MDLWKIILQEVNKRIDESVYQTWFRPVLFLSQDHNTIKVSVPTSYFRNAFLEKFSSLLQGIFNDLSLSNFQLFIVVEEDTPSQESGSEVSLSEKWNAAQEGSGLSINLNPKYTFDSFVVGNSNQFAHAAAFAVAKQPSHAYNPLYIHGSSALGKTHLMHAIGHSILSKNAHLKLVYVPAEKFTNDMINAIKMDRTYRFREVYRNIDILLMDDIQFLAGKERTQEEFFHTFNSLYDAQKQIVITSDCPPKEIPTLEERLHSRFEWGLIADIQPPDTETRFAILKKKASEKNVDLADDVALFIAHQVKSHVRALESALNRIMALSEMSGSEIDLAFTEEALAGIVQMGKNNLTSEIILKAVADHFRMKPSVLKSKNNSREITVPRQIAMYLCKELAQVSLPCIGKTFGGKHHTTVLHSIRKIETDRKKNQEINDLILKISSKFR